MKQKLLFTALIVLLCSTVLSADDVKIAKVERPDAPGFVGYVADEIVVKFDRQVTLALNRDEMASGRTGIWELDELGRFYDIAAMRPQFQGAIERLTGHPKIWPDGTRSNSKGKWMLNGMFKTIKIYALLYKSIRLESILSTPFPRTATMTASGI